MFSASWIDCLDLLHKGYTNDGVYLINPNGNGYFHAYCDQKTNGGGWTVIQRRLNGSVDFYRDRSNYKEGFGNLLWEFWLGNDKIPKTTTQGSQLLIELTDLDNQMAHAHYGLFYVGKETEKYVLYVSEFSGTAGDSMAYHNGNMFSTHDQDNDNSNTIGHSCATSNSGSWWYNDCHHANLNGRYGGVTHDTGINWFTWRGHSYSLKETCMKVRARRGNTLLSF